MMIFSKVKVERVLTQAERCLKMLRRAGSHGVDNHQFARVGILRYGAYLKDLRDDGYTITTERRKLKNGKASNVYVYTLVEEA